MSRYKIKDKEEIEIDENKPFKDIEWVALKKAINVILIVIMIILSFSLIIGIVRAEDDLDYTFQEVLNYEDTNLSNDYFLDSRRNFRERTRYISGGIATFPFTNDLAGNDPAEFTIYEGTGNEIQVVQNLGGKYKVLQFLDQDVSGLCYARQTFNVTVQRGFIEFFYYINETNKEGTFIIGDQQEFKVDAVHIIFANNGYIQYDDGSTHNIIQYQASLWYHVRIEFECQNEGFSGLSPDTFYIYINNVKYGPYNFENGVDYMKLIYISTSSSYSDYEFYIDSIGYGWERGNWNFNDLDASASGVSWEGNYSAWNTGINDNQEINVENYASYILDGNYLELKNHNNTENLWIQPCFDYRETGNITFSIRTLLRAYPLYIWFLDDYNDPDYLNNVMIWLSFGGSPDYKFYSINDDFSTDEFLTIAQQQWYNVSIIFNCTTNTFEIEIDGTSYGSHEFYANSSYIKSMAFFCPPSPSGDFYVDNLNYSWENIDYTDFANILPEEQTNSNYIEVDKYEFEVESFNTMANSGDDSFLDWEDIEIGTGGGDYVNIEDDPLDLVTTDNVFEVDTPTSATQERGIKRSFNFSDSESIGIIFEFKITDFTDEDGFINFTVKSQDLSDLVNIRILGDTVIQYYDGVSYTNLTFTKSQDYYKFRLYIDYSLDLCIFYYYYSSNPLAYGYTLENFYPLGLLSLSKNGLGYVETTFNVITGGETCKGYIDAIGIYGNEGIPKTTEIAYRLAITGISFNTTQTPMVETDINYGDQIQLSLSTSDFTDYVYSLYAKNNFNFYSYTEWDRRNLYDYWGGLYPVPLFENILLQFKYNMSQFNEIKIWGVKLVESTHNYWLKYQSGGVNSNDNYFYVDSSNRLRWAFTSNNNSQLEYIQAEFDIPNILTINRSLVFTGKKTSGLKVYWRLNYTDATSTFYEFKTYQTTQQNVLLRDKKITSFIMLISDGGETIKDTDNGWVYNLSLLWNPNYSLTVITLSLLNILVPILILIVPTFAMHKRFGKSAILPMLILMSIICFIADLIPSWLFVIMLISFGALLFVKYKSGSED